MNTTLIVVIAILSLASLITTIVVLTRFREMENARAKDKNIEMLNQNLVGMNQRIDKTTETIGQSLQNVSDKLNQRLTEAAKVIGNVQKELGTVQERFKGFEEFSELFHPKMRGNVGEQILKDMLSQFFPKELYDLQFRFKDGQIVDAALKTTAGIVCIDSKFPLENFQQIYRAQTDAERQAAQKEFAKAVKKHIDDIAKKYILPDEGTVNFAVMYIPSENIYYHILTDEDNALLEHAKTRNVFAVSPHGFFSFLRVILMGMERSRLQEQAQKIWEILKGVQQESGKFAEDLDVLAHHVTNTKGAMEKVSSKYLKLTGRLDQIKLLE